MKYTVEMMEEFSVIGFERIIKFNDGYEECPKFWSEYRERYMIPLMEKGESSNDLEKAVMDYGIGEFGVCVGSDNGTFRYMIAGQYSGGDVPKNLTVYKFPDMMWAKFTGVGKMPDALQKLNTEIFTNWLPNNGEYELAENTNIEWYSSGKIDDDNYLFGIWVPVKKKD